MFVDGLLTVAAVLQGAAVVYGTVLLTRRRGATAAWSFLLGAMLSMFVWRVVVLMGIEPPAFFTPLIAIWGSSCMVAAMFFFGREVARRAAAEAERDALLESERAARSDAERASRSKDEFLATLSHELRTPLAAIASWCTVLRIKRDAADLDRAVDTIERNARAQARLVDDLLDVSRMQAGSLHVDRVPVALDGPVRAAVEAVRPAADAKRILIVLTVDAEPPWVSGDAMRLEQIAANLIGNAVKFTPPDGTVTVTVRSADDRALLVVADDGMGIEPAFLPHVFRPFRQADSGVTRRHGGLGLGLAIVTKLVELHAGEVRAASDGLGTGATFTVAMPRVATAAPSAGAVDASRPDVTDAELARRRVLIVDDEPDVRAGLARLLEAAGAEVLALESGATIVAALTEFRPDVLLIDIGMPGEDGYSLIRRIRALPATAGGATPALSLTAHARSEDRARALASGFQQHLPKPISFAALVAAIRELTSDGAAATRGA